MKMDLNCDLGEFDQTEVDAAVMPYITSANVACGLHAGGAAVMQKVIRLAKVHNVQVGAHPSWPDRENFGRQAMRLPFEEVQALLWYQMGALAAIARAEGVEMRHVKPHGALYNQAAVDVELAEAIARAVKRFRQDLVVVGLAGSCLVEVARNLGLPVAAEAFPDRQYLPDGTLMPRNLPGAVLEDPAEIAQNAVRLAQQGIRVGEKWVLPDTLCLHGDHQTAIENVRQTCAALQAAGIRVQPF
ncbi:MAG: LamB/YcsF family protein [Anaerolineae bacterium]|nr:MAG: LamB/YcsF family protein [Anaerolineae bacterium]